MSYIVDGRQMTEEEFRKFQEEIQKNPNLKLQLVEGKSNEFKTLQKMYG